MTIQRNAIMPRLSLPVLTILLLSAASAQPADSATDVRVTQTDQYVQIDTDALQARINKKGYVSGVAAGTLLDKKTGASDIGFGLHIMDFLMAPGWADDGYPRDAKLHGDLPKHYIEGPQICTQAKELSPEVIEGKGFVAVRMRYRFTKPAAGLKAGSLWEQTLVFQPGLRYFLSGERITSVNDVNDLFYRIDMPGHIRHSGDDTFSQVYLSYRDKPIPASEFAEDFAPDAKFLYQRHENKVPARMSDVRPGGSVGGVVPSTRLCLLHSGNAQAQGQSWRNVRGRLCGGLFRRHSGDGEGLRPLQELSPACCGKWTVSFGMNGARRLFVS
jgi:hypothetical protein